MIDYILFSIVIPTYNRSKMLRIALDSLIKQEYQNFEIIVVDDGGNDDSENVVRGLKDTRLSYFWKENGERAAARNYGAKISKGDYINFFDSDDIAYPNHLQTAYNTIIAKNNPEVFHLGYDGKIGDKVIYQINNFDGNVLNYCIKKKMLSVNSLFLKHSVTQHIPFHESRSLSASEDAVHICQLAARFKLHYNNTITTTIVEHANRSMLLASPQQLLQRRYIMLEILENDKIFMNKYGAYLKNIKKEFDFLLSLSCLVANNFSESRKYFKEYLFFSPLSFFDIRSIVFIKKYIGSLINK